jgi:OOP family OmpA-OmpF porin
MRHSRVNETVYYLYKRRKEMAKRSVVKSLISVMVLFFLIGCTAKEHVPIPSFSAKTINADIYSPKIDNFLIVFDGSISMRHKIKEEVKLDIAKAIVDRMNQTIPEMGQTAGLRSFGHAPDVSKEYTSLLYGMTEYSSQDLGKQFNVTTAGGLSKLDAALDAAQVDFENLSGARNAVIIISDGLDLGANALASAQELKDKYGSSICFYTIQVGDAPEGKEVLQKIAKIGDCGFYSEHEALLTSTGITDFVKNEFLAEKPKKAAAPAAVVITAVNQDTDNDGVYDADDRCPKTPDGASVNPVGCWAFSNAALFDFDKSEIKSEAYPMINEAVTILKKNPSMNVTLQGHTDNTGNAEYNMGLSLRRANAIKAYLVDNGISEDRLAAEGFGSTQPSAPNSSEIGRSLNRRVELKPR